MGRSQADHNSVVRGTVQHEVLEGRAAVAFAAGEALAIDIDCRIDAGRLASAVRYGIGVSLEIAAAVRADLPAQVAEQLQIQLRQRTTAEVATRARS